MAIADGDIKILASKVMDDVPEGGGGPTGNVIEWGKSNQIFDDITRVARAGGRRPAGRLVALSQSVEAESGAIVFRIDLRGALACMAATGPDGTMLMRAACLREGPGTDARPSIH